MICKEGLWLKNHHNLTVVRPRLKWLASPQCWQWMIAMRKIHRIPLSNKSQSKSMNQLNMTLTCKFTIKNMRFLKLSSNSSQISSWNYYSRSKKQFKMIKFKTNSISCLLHRRTHLQNLYWSKANEIQSADGLWTSSVKAICTLLRSLSKKNYRCTHHLKSTRISSLIKAIKTWLKRTKVAT